MNKFKKKSLNELMISVGRGHIKNKEIVKFKPDILLSVDSPDFTLRVAEKVKKINSNIKTIHYVAPQVWVWRCLLYTSPSPRDRG